MCGIAGILNLSADRQVTADELHLMAAAQSHRGPDDEQVHLDPRGRCGLAFRRLSIIDLSGGRQPVANEDESVWCAFNGEIYNFRELRQELEAAGHRFRTRSDGEVIVHAYEQWGDACFAKLAGMFAIALWDGRTGELILARDRFGKKPLHYAVHDGRLVLASELKALLALPGFPRVVDRGALHHYLVLQYVPAPLCIYRGVCKLLPGRFLRIRPGRPPPLPEHGEAPDHFAERSGQQPYWMLPTPPRFGSSYEDAQRRLGELLTGAVERRLISDVPLGAFLSGGIDSSIVVGLMRRLGVSPLRTFSIGFPVERYDETRFARRVAAQFQTEHHEQIVTPQAREVLDTLAYHYDEPFADSSAIPTWYVAHYTRQHVTVALTGDGGDEAFGGYDRYRAARLSARFDRWPAAARHALAQLGTLIPHGRGRSFGSRAYRFLHALADAPADRYASWITVFREAELRAAYRDDAEIPAPSAEHWLSEIARGQPGDPAERAIATDFLSYLPYDLLTKVDIASMACSLECRSPFLDHELVEFALSLPIEWRAGGRGGKRILRDWARGLLPAEVLARSKMGFGVPVGEWFRGELRGLLTNTLGDPDGICGRLLRRDWLDALVADHLSGRANHEHRLWALLMLELWWKRWQPRW